MNYTYYDDFDGDGYLDYIHYRKQLPEVFNTKLDLFPNVKEHRVTGKQIELYDLFQKIKYNLAQDITCDILLTDKYLNGEINPNYEKKKEEFPAIAYNATFDDYKELGNIKRITNLMFLDMDCFKTKQEAESYKKEIIDKYPWIISCYRSLSKIGLHIIIQVDMIYDNDDYNAKYDFISQMYFEGKLDKNSKSLSRFTIIPFDYDIHINDNPQILEIDKEIKSNKKGIRSAYNSTEYTFSPDINKKGISSAYLTENSKESIRSSIKGERVCTAYTFSPLPSLEDILNETARKYNLRFQIQLDESNFTDPNIPIYIHEGIDIIKVNLFPFRYRKVITGERNAFLGAITIQMFYLNIDPNKVIPEIKNAILYFILSINNKICRPPLDKHEVITLFNSNFKRFIKGHINYQNYYVLQRAFWSEKSTLRGNEKRKVTCRIKNEPILAETKRKIKLGIERLQAKGQKVTQKALADEIENLSLGTVKKYRNYYNEVLGRKREKSGNETNENSSDVVPNQKLSSIGQLEKSINSATDQDKTLLQLGRKCDEIKNFDISDDQMKMVFKRIFKPFLKEMNSVQEETLYSRFIDRFDLYPDDDKKILISDVDIIENSEIYWKQNMLDSKFWVIFSEVVKLP